VRVEFAAAAARPEQHTVTCTGGGHAGSVCQTQQRSCLAVWLDDSNCDADHPGLVYIQLFGGRGIEQHRRGDSQRVCHWKRRRTLAVAVSFIGYPLKQCGAGVHPLSWQELCRQQLSSKCNFACSGTWYNILEWAARSTSCSEAPDSVACMACSQAMPAYAQAAGVGPIGRRC